VEQGQCSGRRDLEEARGRRKDQAAGDADLRRGLAKEAEFRVGAEGQPQRSRAGFGAREDLDPEPRLVAEREPNAAALANVVRRGRCRVQRPADRRDVPAVWGGIAPHIRRVVSDISFTHRGYFRISSSKSK
jgi:hypothetical protein